MSKDDKEPFKGLEEDQYYFTDPLHLSGLNINLRKELNIGLRYITVDETDSPVVHVFSDDFIKQTEAEKVTKDIDFDDLEPVYTKVVDTLKNLSKSNIAEIEEHERIKKEEAEKEAREEELKKASEDEPSETSEFVENDTYEDENVADEEYEEYEDDEVEDETFVETPPQNSIEALKDDLYEAIDNEVPRVHLSDDITIDYDDKAYTDNETYSELEKVALDTVARAQNERVNLLEQKRIESINTLFRNATPILWQKYLDNNKLLNYESDDSEYHAEYSRILGKFKDVEKSANSQYEQEHARLTREFDKDKERRAQQAYEEAKARIEAEERHLVDEQADAFKENLLDDALEEYNQQIGALESDVNIVYNTRLHSIVDNVVEESRPDILKYADEIHSEREKTIEYINAKHDKEMQALKQEIMDLEKERTRVQGQFEDKLDLEINKRTETLKQAQSEAEKENESLANRLKALEEKYEDAQIKAKDYEERIKNQEIEKDHLNKRAENAEKDAELYRDKYENQVEKTFKAYDDNVMRSANYSNTVQPPAQQHVQGVAQGSKYGNFNQVVAPENEQGEGNLTNLEGSTEKVAKPHTVRPEKAPVVDGQSLMASTADGQNKEIRNQNNKGRNIVVGSFLGTTILGASVVGSTMYAEQQQDERMDKMQNSFENVQQYNQTDSAKHLSKGDKLTIDVGEGSDKQLKPAEVIDNKGSNIIVKTPDGDKFKLDK